MAKDIYKLKLHEAIKVITEGYAYYVTRVPGGWLYEGSRATTFVPFSNEFMVTPDDDGDKTLRKLYQDAT